MTTRGRPLALIRNIVVDEAARLAALATAGIIKRAAKPTPMPRPRWQPETLRGKSIAETVRHERGDSA